VAKVLNRKIIRILFFLFKPGKKSEQRFQGGSSQATWILYKQCDEDFSLNSMTFSSADKARFSVLGDELNEAAILGPLACTGGPLEK
jgi:hypothetical protein